MPQRQRTRTITTLELQGLDSWVKVKAITIAEARAFQKSFQPLQKEGAELREQLADLEPTEDNAEMIADIETRIAEIDRNANGMFAEYVVDWNWVDDDGKALPKPAGNPDVFDLLTTIELNFIGNAIMTADDASQKKGLKSARR